MQSSCVPLRIYRQRRLRRFAFPIIRGRFLGCGWIFGVPMTIALMALWTSVWAQSALGAAIAVFFILNWTGGVKKDLQEAFRIRLVPRFQPALFKDTRTFHSGHALLWHFDATEEYTQQTAVLPLSSYMEGWEDPREGMDTIDALLEMSPSEAHTKELVKLRGALATACAKGAVFQLKIATGSTLQDSIWTPVFKGGEWVSPADEGYS